MGKVENRLDKMRLISKEEAIALRHAYPFSFSKKTNPINKKEGFFNRFLKHFEGFVRSTLDFIDVCYHTVIRVVQVLSNVVANKTNSDAENPNSWFNRQVYQGQRYAGLTSAQWGLTGGSIIFVILGAARRYYIIKHQEKLSSPEYILEILEEDRKKLGLPPKLDFAQVIMETLDLNPDKMLTREDIALAIKQKTLAAQEKAMAALAKKLTGKYKLQEIADPNSFFSDTSIEEEVDKAIAKNHKVTNFILKKQESSFIKGWNAIYEKLATTAGFFWLTFIISVCIIGIAATIIPPALPIVTFAAIGIGTLFNVGFAIARHNTKPIPKKDSIQEQVNAEIHLRYVAQQEHHHVLTRMEQLVTELAKENEKKSYHRIFPKLYGKKTYKSIAQIAAEFKLAQQNATTSIAEEDYFKNILQKSPSGFEKFVLIADKIKGHATTVTFILWLISSTFAGLAATSLSSSMAFLAGFFANPILTLVLFAIAGVIGGITAYAYYKKTRLCNEQKVNKIKDAKYKPEKHNSHHERLEHVNKQQAFNVLYSRVQQLHKSITKSKENIKNVRAARVKNGATVSKAILDAEDFILNYDLNAHDVTNDYFHEKFKSKPTAMSGFKKFLNRAFQFFSGIGNGIYQTRFLGLKPGGILATALVTLGVMMFGPAGGAILFIAAVAFLGLLFAGLSIAHYQITKNHEHKAGFIKKFDARLGILRKSYFELDYLEKLSKIASGDNKLGVKAITANPTRKTEQRNKHTALIPLSKSTSSNNPAKAPRPAYANPAVLFAQRKDLAKTDGAVAANTPGPAMNTNTPQ